MIRLIEALNYRCLRYIRQPLDPFHVLVGPNASGKSTFLDVVAFLGDLVRDGPEAAVRNRTQNFQDLVFGREGNSFELAIEAEIPEQRLALLGDNPYEGIRYEVQIGTSSEDGKIGVLREQLVFIQTLDASAYGKRLLFPDIGEPPKTILTPKGRRRDQRGTRRILSKAEGQNDNFYSEVTKSSGKGWFPSIRLGIGRSALGNLPEDESKFPSATWLKGLLSQGIQSVMLNSRLLRRASPPGKGTAFEPDGSNLPWVIAQLEESSTRFREWIEHLQTALSQLIGVRTVERPDDRHRYVMLQYSGGLEIPSWMASDGTLRLLALTLPAYLPEMQGVYLIEEPENGVHPRAVETMIQSLSSVYDAQVLLATHSPVVISSVDPESVLCFKKTAEGATDIVRGSDHPMLSDWKGDPNLSVLFASGVLG